MRGYLLDTHILLWWLAGSSRLPRQLHAVLEEGQNPLFFSAAGIWEIVIKQSLGRLDVPDELAAVLQEEGIDTLPIEAKHAYALAHLPLHHRDPFDRILVAQARSEGLTLISEDRKIRAYNVDLLSGN